MLLVGQFRFYPLQIAFSRLASFRFTAFMSFSVCPCRELGNILRVSGLASVRQASWLFCWPDEGLESAWARRWHTGDFVAARNRFPLGREQRDPGWGKRGTTAYFAATAFLGNISPMRLICAPTSFNFSSMCS